MKNCSWSLEAKDLISKNPNNQPKNHSDEGNARIGRKAVMYICKGFG